MSAPTRPQPTTAEYVAALVNSAPAPTAEQIVTLRDLLGPALVEVRAAEPVPSRVRPVRDRAEGRRAA